MKNEVGLMTLPKIKQLIRLRWLCMLLSIFFIYYADRDFFFWETGDALAVAGSFLAAGAFGSLTLACCAGYLVLNK